MPRSSSWQRSQKRSVRQIPVTLVLLAPLDGLSTHPPAPPPQKEGRRAARPSPRSPCSARRGPARPRGGRRQLLQGPSAHVRAGDSGDSGGDGGLSLRAATLRMPSLPGSPSVVLSLTVTCRQALPLAGGRGNRPPFPVMSVGRRMKRRWGRRRSRRHG